MSKRTNERSQQSKEDYDAAEARAQLTLNDGGVDGEIGQFRTASSDTLRSRRIIRTSKKKWNAATGQPKPATTTPSRIPPPFSTWTTVPNTSTSQPFSGFSFSSATLAATTNTPNTQVSAARTTNITLNAPVFSTSGGGAGEGGKGNPFAKVNLAASSTSTSSVSQNTAKSSSVPAENEGIGNNPEALLLQLDMLEQAGESIMESRYRSLKPLIKRYRRVRKKLLKECNDGKALTPSLTPATDSASKSCSTSFSVPSKFSFGAPTARTSATETSTDDDENKTSSVAAASSFTGFTFGARSTNASSTTTPPPPARSNATGFQFDKTIAPPAPAPAPASSSGDDTGDGKQMDKIEKVAGEENEEEETVFQIRARYYKEDENKQWKAFTSGPVRLLRHKTDDTRRRIVLRNDVGRVQLNLSIVRGMKFVKIQRKMKQGEFKGVQFVAIATKEAGPEKFMMKVADNLDDLYNNLVELAK